VPPGDRAALRDAIRALLDDPLARASLRAGGLVSVRRGFSLQDVVNNIVRVLDVR
jgi:glycosyltransferase involved in cell wall biosynthesis